MISFGFEIATIKPCLKPPVVTLDALMLDSANVDVKGVQVLELEIRRLENNFCDHGNWLNPWLE